MKPVTAKTRPVLSTRYKIEHKIAAVLRRLGLYSLVHALYGRLFKKNRGVNLQEHDASFRPTELAQLTPEARKIYEHLKMDIHNRKQGGR
jgi:hypothetical protein